MTSRFTMRPNDHLGDVAAKQALNLALFDVVAPKYDFITRALSLGRDADWKRRLVTGLPERAAPTCVDLACGTGDITRLLAGRFPRGRVIGVDLTPAMLDIARKRSAGHTIEYVEGTMHALPFSDASVDIVTGGYALRNAPDLDAALHQVSRVLRPGGTAAFLDFSKPASPAGQAVHHGLLKSWGGFWGLMLHANASVYGYIADSLRLYPGREELRRRCRQHDLQVWHSRRFYGGLLENITLRKVDGIP